MAQPHTLSTEVTTPMTKCADPAPGDIVVTRVADRYHIGWVRTDHRPVPAIAFRNTEDEALALACKVRKPDHRVFLFGVAGSTHCVEIDHADYEADDWIE
jgi:hypothetical protein